MLRSLFAKRKDESVHDLIYFFCICLLVISLPTSKSFISIAQVFIGINWLAEGHYKDKIQRFLSNKPAVYLSSVYLVYLAGIFWTQDLAFGFGYDLFNKLPILTLTFTLASIKPLTSDRIYAVPIVFSLSVFVTTLIGFAIFLSNQYIDPRNISPFLLHIPYSKILVMAVFLLPWGIYNITSKQTWFYLSLLVSLWMLIFLFILSSMTGIFCLGGVILFLLFRALFAKPYKKKINALFALIVLCGSICLILYITIKPLILEIDPPPASLSELTSEGNPYYHDLNSSLRENGHLIYYFIAEEELRNAWNKRSNISFDSTDLKGHKIKATIYRYLTSKGLKKDKKGLNSLDDKEIKAIEHGIANYLYTKWPNFLVRIHQTLWEIQGYKRTGNPERHSFTSRLEIWKASWTSFMKYPIFGWGTGDVYEAVNYGLSAINSPLDSSMIKPHPHNQLLRLLIMVGLVGTILICTLFYLFVKHSQAYHYLFFNILLVIFFVGMIVDTPVDTQAGLSFFLFFLLFFGIMYPRRKVKKLEY